MNSKARAEDLKNRNRWDLPEMEQAEWYKQIYDLSSTLCVVMNTDGFIIDCNLAFTKVLGYAAKGQIIGSSFFDCTAPASKETLQKSFETWRRIGKVHNHEFKMKRADGSMFPALINATSIHDELGRTIACNASILNITELVNARKKVEVGMNELIHKETQLRELNEELKRVERAKEEFVSLVSHELKNPLTPILGFSELIHKQGIADKTFNDKQLEMIRIINSSATEMKRLIDDMLSVYKLDMRLEFAYTETRITELVDQVIMELESIFEEKSIKIERKVMLEDGEETVISCDALRVRQVLVNLMRNAVDFVPASGGQIKIILDDDNFDAKANRSRDVSPPVLFSVADNGPGIPADKQGNLFKKFYQVSPGVTRRHGGTGLGLTICKEIVEMHGGRIWYDSSYKDGACFRFSLPRAAGMDHVKNSAA